MCVTQQKNSKSPCIEIQVKVWWMPKLHSVTSLNFQQKNLIQQFNFIFHKLWTVIKYTICIYINGRIRSPEYLENVIIKA